MEFVRASGASTSGSEPSFSRNEEQSSTRGGVLRYASIQESNIGFQLLKKAGWREGTGLGASEQGQLNPVQTYLKLDKRGLGAEKNEKRVSLQSNSLKSAKQKKAKTIAKAAKKLADDEARDQEKEIIRAFYREFWPENV